MRRYIKLDLINLIEQLLQINETLLKKGRGINSEQIQGIMTDCATVQKEPM